MREPLIALCLDEGTLISASAFRVPVLLRKQNTGPVCVCARARVYVCVRAHTGTMIIIDQLMSSTSRGH